MELGDNIKTVDDLIEALQAWSNEGYGDVEVRIAEQPHWPIAARIVATTLCERPHEGTKLWLATGGVHGNESGYAPHEAWVGGIPEEEEDY